MCKTGQKSPDILEGGGHDDTEAEQEDVGVRVDERAEGVEVVLAGGVAELEGEGLAVHVDHGVVRVDGRGHVLVRVAVRRVGDDQTGLAHGAVSDEDALGGRDEVTVRVEETDLNLVGVTGGVAVDALERWRVLGGEGLGPLGKMGALGRQVVWALGRQVVGALGR